MRVVVATTLADDALIVPVAALLAPAEGGYAVEVVEGPATAGRRRRRCDPRRAAEISGDVAEGDTVVVAG